jgi:hypothetical protein
MTDDKRASEIRNLLWEHAHPTLRGMDGERIAKLAEQILRIVTNRGLLTCGWLNARYRKGAPRSQNGRWRPKPSTSEVHPRPRGRAASIPCQPDAAPCLAYNVI